MKHRMKHGTRICFKYICFQSVIDKKECFTGLNFGDPRLYYHAFI